MIVEDPTYFLVFDMIRDLGHSVVPVDASSEQAFLASLEGALAAAPARPSGQYRAMVYLVPDFSNPRGSLLSDGARRAVVELAARHGAVVVCDDVYTLLPFQAEDAPMRLAAYDPARCHVVSNGSFSKIFGPGLRLGWIEAGPAVIARLSTL